MNTTLTRATARGLAALFAALPMQGLSADPCGMVWQIATVGGAVQRIGVQSTYVFFDKGIETIVLRPGYRGKAKNFGMLIPFPTPPAIHKVEDDVFPHIAKAAEPPEVVVRLPSADDFFMGAAPVAGGGPRGPSAPGMGGPSAGLRVLREEAVGMYQVAVLQAGSADALAGWMDGNGYKYPDGMDNTCEDYIADGWCFVAVKTRIVKKSEVDARPGMRSVGGPGQVRKRDFDGFIQAMSFRFRTEDPVLPMRLSVFNEGAPKDVVYALTDRPVKLKGMPDAFVTRQVRGRVLREYLTQLPLRVIGGTEKAIPKGWRAGIERRRNPERHNGIAKRLFMSDLLAARSDSLSLDYERTAKALRRRGESRGLDGKPLDAYVQGLIDEQRDDELKGMLARLDSMVLSVIEGKFPDELLASANLEFETYTAPLERRPQLKRLGFGTAVPETFLSQPRRWLPVVASVLLSAAFVSRRARKVDTITTM